ncbi:unnamed protein product [Paramecium octaurelia]|uniref:Uncharacterized protein n=1 Tax=Paramecium octaurelia TaxID=43137 RepID=A0A8S1YDN2_PAROT|nr:unnamed protein product [Paramecium octaurelia]
MIHVAEFCKGIHNKHPESFINSYILLCNSIDVSFVQSTYKCLLLYEYNQIRPSYNVSEFNKQVMLDEQLDEQIQTLQQLQEWNQQQLKKKIYNLFNVLLNHKFHRVRIIDQVISKDSIRCLTNQKCIMNRKAQTREAKKNNIFFLEVLIMILLEITLILGSRQCFYHHRIQTIEKLGQKLIPFDSKHCAYHMFLYWKSDRVLHLLNQLNKHQLNSITSSNILVLCLLYWSSFLYILSLRQLHLQIRAKLIDTNTQFNLQSMLDFLCEITCPCWMHTFAFVFHQDP